MSKVDIRLEYQKETGDGLEYLNRFIDNPQVEITVMCPECECDFEEGGFIREELLDYLKWLESKVEKSESRQFLQILKDSDKSRNQIIFYATKKDKTP